VVRSSCCKFCPIGFLIFLALLILDLSFTSIGTLLLTASQNKAMFMVGRLLSGTGVAVAANAAPSYVTEMSPPQWRGRMGGMYNVSLPSSVYGKSYLSTTRPSELVLCRS
jgi:MFS family permease